MSSWLCRGTYPIVAACMVWLLALSGGHAEETRFIDLSLLVAENYPCTWPDGFPHFKLEHVESIGRESAYHVDTLTIDGNTGTQMDVPPHSVARPELELPHSGPYGLEFTHKTPAWKFVGEACVVDIRELLDQGANGVSSLVLTDHITNWEAQHRPLRFGDVVLFHSGYSDKYYLPLPAGRRFIADVLEKKYPGYPDPHPDTMEYIAQRGVFHIGTDSPSMGTLPDLGEQAHYAALQYGAIFTEGATRLGQLPPRGAFYGLLGPKHKDGPYGEARAFAIVGGELPGRLIESAANKRVLDLSVVMSIDHPLTWPGRGVDQHRHRYTKADFLYASHLDLYHHTHILDSHAGTHLVPPAYALPPEPMDANAYAPQTRIWLDEYQREFGPRGVSRVTTEQVPLAQTCGRARVIDVRSLVGTTTRGAWPASPPITPQLIEQYEAATRPLQAGEIVIFHSGHTDRHFQPFPAGAACLAEPLAGKSEGWPAPTAAAIMLLAERGVRCVATDGPTLGGVDPREALRTYWALGSRGMVGVEFLTNIDQLPPDAYFLFAAVKIRGCHGGPGRAIALY